MVHIDPQTHMGNTMNGNELAIVEAAQALCKLMSEEDWHGIISAAESAGCLDAYKKEGNQLMGKLIDLALAVQEYEG